MNGEADRNAGEPAENDVTEAHEDSRRVADPAAETELSGDEEIAALRAKAEENWDRYLRAAAELENVRKRASRDVENARRFALERFAGELLNVMDSLEMGLSAGEEAGAQAILEGSQATLKLLNGTMEQFGVSEVDPQGEPFDPEFHEAMAMQPSADVEPGSVLAVYQKGYTLNGRLLRPARVVVSQALPDEADASE